MIPPSDVFEKLDEKIAKRFEGGEEMIVNSSSFPTQRGPESCDHTPFRDNL